MPLPRWTVTSAVDCCSDCRSVLTAMNSTPGIPASTMRLIALTPAPPTPTTRITGACGRRVAEVAAVGGLVAAVGRPVGVEDVVGEDPGEPLAGGGRLRHVVRLDLRRAPRARRRSGRRPPAPRPRGPPGASARTGAARRARSSSPRSRSSRSRDPGAGASGGSSGSTVERKRSASGPSRMLARLRRAIRQNLLRQLAVVVGGVALGIVLEHARTREPAPRRT